jgi:GT2 family glycosyltransferase
LTFILKFIEKEETIGMVCSKIIYPNGEMQEVGGIIWNNGESTNFGHGKNLDMPEYNYVKEVVYITGALIIIRKPIWEILGGFDVILAPAYYEDIDLPLN